MLHPAHPATVALIKGDVAEMVVSRGTHGAAIAEAHDAANAAGEGGLFVQDTSFEGYNEVPAWIVEGYSTLLSVDEQAARGWVRPRVVVTPVGVGLRSRSPLDRTCPRRPSIIGLRGSGGEKTIMLSGHIDTVSYGVTHLMPTPERRA